jgi:CheY-like chemotaxis protein
VHIISSVDKKQLGIDMGATSYLSKPAGREEMEELFNKIGITPHTNRKLLYLGAKSEEIDKVLSALRAREENIEFYRVENLSDCISLAGKEKFQCMIIDSGKDENTTKQLVLDIRAQDRLRLMPLVFCANNPDECLREVEEVFNGTADKSKEMVLDEAGVFLDTVSLGTDNFIDVQNRMNELLIGKTALIVDDDMRNIYSMTNVLENEGLNVICAYDGQEGLEKLEANPEIDIVLMDIMMPNMNGYEAIQLIRKNPLWQKLPVIGVTAKAMAGDREKCMEAGASDYLTKPIITEQLISLMRVWLYK